jgi:hypothetical protein
MTQPLDFDDTSKCPLCGEQNQCAIAAGKRHESCWCMSATMDPKALAAIPVEAHGKVCICPRCARGAAPEL